MQTVRVGFIHRRKSLRFELPEGSRIAGPLGSVEVRGELRVALLGSSPAVLREGVKVLESPDSRLLERVAERLQSSGLSPRIADFAPGGDYGSCRVPATCLLYAAHEGGASPRGLSSGHMQREQGDERDRSLHRRILDSLADLARERSWENSRDLWFTASAVPFRETLEPSGGAVKVRGESGPVWNTTTGPLTIALPPGETVSVAEVEVGIGFHWQHRTELCYNGSLIVFVDADGLLGAANELVLEQYLAGVNSSEMTADSPRELLMAQTVAARSTILATRGRHHAGEPFDLCADDHCQCFRGTGSIRESSLTAARDTAGLVLSHEGEVCDARYSKCCGGIVEAYENVWEDRILPYLSPSSDLRSAPVPPSEARGEEDWRRWIDSAEDAWCNTEDWELPAGLAHCADAYRWRVETTRGELACTIRRKTGFAFDSLEELRPAGRGASGRLTALDIVTDRGIRRIGRELGIRLALSESCLRSAAIWFERAGDSVVIHGKGWGHGVGMCQLGATRMAVEGRGFREILAHYYPGSRLVRIGKESS